MKQKIECLLAWSAQPKKSPVITREFINPKTKKLCKKSYYFSLANV